MLQAIVLGLVQGLTEFLPVSSSGHLVIVPYLFGWQQPPLTFDIALHFGTLIAVLSYFWGDLWYLATRSIGVAVEEEGEAARARKTIGLLALGSVPAAVAGFALESQFERLFGEPRMVSLFLLVTAGLLYLAERIRRKRAALLAGKPVGELSATERNVDPGRNEATTSWLDAFVIGCAQALAILPGISRSGSTIAAGMMRGLSREGAARFSFLLMIPVVAGATAFKLPDLSDADQVFSNLEIAVGVGVAAASGYWAIRFLLRFVQSDDLTGFARYVAFFGVLAFVGTLWLGDPSTV